MIALRSVILAILCTLILLASVKSDESTDRTTPATVRQNSFIQWLISIFLPSAPPNISIKPTKVPENCATCTCGTANTVKRIVGGYETQVNQYPWMAMLALRNRFYCGGSLISDLYVVSAAHCIMGFPTDLITVTLLAHKKIRSKSELIKRSVESVRVHPGYSPRTFDNDISLIKLNKRVEMTETLRPVCMPMSGNNYDGEEAIITGWGATSEGGPLAASLQEVRVPIISLEDCRKTKYGSRISENMLCAGIDEGGKDACQGDSGGPLHVNVAEVNTFHLAGVVSWGEGCARPDYPGIYTRVTQYLPWIEKNTGDACNCEMPTKKLSPLEIEIVD